MTTYYFMGEQIEVEGYKSFEVSMCLASIECNGWKYYESLKRNSIQLGNIGDIVEKIYLKHCRDNKISEILETNI